MKSREHISRRVLHHFLNLAALTFAVGANAAAGLGDDEEIRSAASSRGDDARIEEAGEDSPHENYQHTFALAPAADGAPRRESSVLVRVLDSFGRKHAQLALHGASMLGPLADGVYTVLIKADGLTEVHRIRIGAGTLPYLHFTETV